MAWHKCGKYDLYVNNDGKVEFGTRDNGYGYDVRVDVYKSYVGYPGYYNMNGKLTLKTVRNGIYDGSIKMFG